MISHNVSKFWDGDTLSQILETMQSYDELIVGEYELQMIKYLDEDGDFQYRLNIVYEEG